MLPFKSLNMLGLRVAQQTSRRFLTSPLSKACLQGKGSRINSINGTHFNAKVHTAAGKQKSKAWYFIIGSSLVIGTGFVASKLFKDEQIDIKKNSKKEAKKEEKKPIFLDLPKEVPYLIIGAGTAAYSASRSIKALDQDAKILMVGDEMYFPYMRPPLSKELWYTDDNEKVKNLVFKSYSGKDRTVFFEKEDYFCAAKDLENSEHGGIAVALGLRASKIDVENQIVHFTNGQSIAYKKCLIATGGTPKNLTVFKNVDDEVSERLTLFRNIEDFKKLNQLTNKVKNVVIIGGGFMGSELACALGNKASELKTLKVTQIFPESGNMGQVLPEFLSKFASEKVKEEGAQVLAGKHVTNVKYDKRNKCVLLGLDDGNEVTADHVIVSVGLDPNIDLAKESGLEVDPKLGGFLVNAELEARSNLWVAGDAACFYDPKLGRRRVEHHDHAVVSGRLAGENMTGAKKPYWHQSMLWSDLGASVGYEAIGLVDSSLPTVSVFAKADPDDSKPSEESKAKNTSSADLPTIVEVSNPVKSKLEDEMQKGIIFYLKDDVIVGILLWNVFNKMPVARQVIKESRKFDDYTEVAKLFHLFGEPEEEQSSAS